MARLLKYLVFLSPWLAYRTQDHWLHILASLSRTFIFALSSLSRMLIPLLKASASTWTSNFFFLSNSFYTLPKHFRFHQARCWPHWSILFSTSLSKFGLKKFLHATSTLFPTLIIWEPHFFEAKQFVSLRNLKTCRINKKRIVIWWITVKMLNSSTWKSKLSHIEWPFTKCLLHAIFFLTKPKSRKSHSSITFRKSCIWLWLCIAPPNF